MAQITIQFDSEKETLSDVIAKLTGSDPSPQLPLPIEDHGIPIRDSERVPVEQFEFRGIPVHDTDAEDKVEAEFAEMAKEDDHDVIEPAPFTRAETVELDKDGVPWDERVHSGNKKKTAKGIWQRRKGLDTSEYKRIIAELKEHAAEPAEPAAEPAAPPAPAAPAAPAAPSAPPAPPAPPAPAAEAASAWTWPMLLKAISTGLMTKKFDNEVVTAEVQKHGVEQVALLSNRVELFDDVAAGLGLVLPE